MGRRGGFWMHVSARAWISLAEIALATETPRGKREHAVRAVVAKGHGSGTDGIE
jgi:hypothetical protein